MIKKVVPILLLISVFLFSVSQVLTYIYSSNKSEKLTESLIDKSVVEPEDSTDTAVPFVLDFEKLQKENKDIVAWLYCENTPINYPVLRCEDNSYYLNHLPDGQYNKNGSLFIDCRCNSDFSDFNTIIYGHNMKTEKMFGSLTNYKKQSYYDEHPILYLLTPQQNYKIELAAGFITLSNSNVYSLIKTSEERKEFIDYALLNSAFSSAVKITETDTLVTLSTCSYENSNARFVVIGKIDNID